MQLCQWLALSGVLHSYLSIICHDNVIFNFYYFIAVLIRKTCSMSLMRFNNCTFYMFFILLVNFNVYHWNRFLTNIVIKACAGFYMLKMVSGKKTKYQQKRILDLSFLFTSKNGYILCHLENFFFFLYLCLKIVIRKSVISPINWNIEKKPTLSTESLKSGTKRINKKMTSSYFLINFPNRCLPD